MIALANRSPVSDSDSETSPYVFKVSYFITVYGASPPDMKSENLACFQNILAAIAGFAKVETGSCLDDDNNKRDCLPHQNHWN